MNLTITLPRQALLNVLQEKRTALEQEWDRVIAEIDQEIDTLPSAATAIKEWYVQVGEMIAEGRAKVNSRDDITSLNDEEDPVPDKPSASSRRTTRSELEREKESAEYNKKHELAHMDSAIRLLELATDDSVSLPTGEYEAMLSNSAERGYRHHCRF